MAQSINDLALFFFGVGSANSSTSITCCEFRLRGREAFAAGLNTVLGRVQVEIEIQGFEAVSNIVRFVAAGLATEVRSGLPGLRFFSL